MRVEAENVVVGKFNATPMILYGLSVNDHTPIRHPYFVVNLDA
jgi:hypothetical protein